MATNFDKPLSAPTQLMNEQPVEVTVGGYDLGPNVTATPDGGVVVDFDPRPDAPQEKHDSNLAEILSDTELTTLSTDLISAFEDDRDSRSEWEKSYITGLDLLGLTFEDRTEPWDGACGVFHPMLSEAVVRFQAQTIQEIFPASGPAKTKIEGNKTPERTEQALRVEGYLNYLATEEMVEYRTETERLLFSLPIAGSAFRKLYFDKAKGRPYAMFVPAEDYVVSYGTSDLATCERATHIMKQSPNQIRKSQVAGFYRKIKLSEATTEVTDVQDKKDELSGTEGSYDTDERHTLLEMQVELDLPGYEEDVALPYVVTIDKTSSDILAIYRNWLESDTKKLKREHVVHYQYLPALGFYGYGLVHMIGGLAKSATSILRQLVDAGTLANLQAGYKTKGLNIKGDDTPLLPGELRDIDIAMGTLRENIMFLPFKEPSNVLYQLLGDLVQEGRRFASAADVKASDMNADAPVGTTLALLEREMKVMSAIQARVHSAMGREQRILAEIVRDYGPEKYPYEIEGEFTVKEDFDARIDVIPVNDPNAGTMAQRIMQYQAAMQLSATASQIYDIPLLHRQMLGVLGIPDADKVVPLDADLKPTDPVTENMNIINTKPVKAFLYQDHEAHLQTHMAMGKHPKLIAAMKDNPLAKTIKASMDAHISEHLAMLYRQNIEQELGFALPPPNEAMPEDIELRLSRLVAPAAAQLTGKALQQEQAEKNAAEQKDPMIQIQQKELEIKEGAVKGKKDTDDKKIRLEAEKAKDKSEIDRERIQLEKSKLTAKVVSDQVKSQADKDKQSAKKQKEEIELGLDIADRIIEASEKDNE